MTEQKTIRKSQKPLISILSVTSLFFFLTTLIFAVYGPIKFNIVRLNNGSLSITNSKKEILDNIRENYIGDYPSDEKIAQAELKGLVASLEDPYSEYLPKAENQKLQDELNKRYEGVGISFKQEKEVIFAQKVLPGSPAKEAGVMDGDVLKKVDEQNIDGQNLDEVAQKVRGPKDSKVKLQFDRGGKYLDFEIIRKNIITELITLDKKADTAIITITSFGENLDTQMQKIAKEIQADSSIKKIIVDLRSNTGGLLKEAIEVVSYFIDPNTIVLQEKSKTKLEYDYSKQKDNTLKSYPVAVLVDRFTASASEIMAGALRDQRNAKLVGQKTYGKGVVQKLFYLSDNNILKLTIAEWLTPKGNTINKSGLNPDYVIKSNEDALQVTLEKNYF